MSKYGVGKVVFHGKPNSTDRRCKVITDGNRARLKTDGMEFPAVFNN